MASLAFSRVLLIIFRAKCDSSFALLNSRCVLLLANRLSAVSKDLPGSNLTRALKLLEEYCWTMIGHGVDSVRHNVRNTLAKIIELSSPEQLASLTDSLMAMDWGDKRKILVLLAVARTAGDGLIVKSNPSAAREILAAMLADPTTSGVCYDLYETLMKSSFKSKKPDWSGCWVRPLFESDLRESDDLNRLRKAAMGMDQSVLAMATAACETNMDGLVGTERESRLRIALLALRIGKVKAADGKAYLQTNCIRLAMASYSDEVRV